MNVRETVFGRHYTYDMFNSVSRETREGNVFTVNAPKKGYVLASTVKPFMNDGLRYMYIQQLNNCDACILTTSCVNSHGHFNSVMRLISYDTCVCEVIFLSENRGNPSKPYARFTIGEHWNYSRTTVQHLYKFLRKFGITNLAVNDLAKADKKQGNGRYTYELTEHVNNVGNVFEVCFTDSIGILDFALNDAQRIVNRNM